MKQADGKIPSMPHLSKSQPFNLLDAHPIAAIRRNHGLEHATLHVLGRRYPHLALAGHSDAGGFWIIGKVPTDDLRLAVNTALERLRQGERHLAVHPNCGTNMVTTGMLTGLGGAMAMMGAGSRRRDKVDRLGLAVMLATLAYVVSRPLGNFLQEKITTSGDPGELRVVDITPTHWGKWQAHRVITSSGP